MNLIWVITWPWHQWLTAAAAAAAITDSVVRAARSS